VTRETGDGTLEKGRGKRPALRHYYYGGFETINGGGKEQKGYSRYSTRLFFRRKKNTGPLAKRGEETLNIGGRKKRERFSPAVKKKERDDFETFEIRKGTPNYIYDKGERATSSQYGVRKHFL